MYWKMISVSHVWRSVLRYTTIISEVFKSHGNFFLRGTLVPLFRYGFIYGLVIKYFLRRPFSFWVMYHGIGQSKIDSVTNADLFQKEMKYIYDNKFKVITISQLGYDAKNNYLYVKELESQPELPPTTTTATNVTTPTEVPTTTTATNVTTQQ